MLCSLRRSQVDLNQVNCPNDAVRPVERSCQTSASTLPNHEALAKTLLDERGDGLVSAALVIVPCQESALFLAIGVQLGAKLAAGGRHFNSRWQPLPWPPAWRSTILAGAPGRGRLPG